MRAVASRTCVLACLAVAWVAPASTQGPAKPATSPPPPAQTKAAPRATANKAPASPAFDKLVADASAAFEAGRLDEALALYGRAIRQRPSYAEGHWYIGSSLYQLDRYRDARDAFRRVTAAQPKNGLAWAMKGLCEFQIGNHDVALSDLLHGRQLGLGGNQELEGSVIYHTSILMTRLAQYELALSELQWFAQRGNDTPRVVEAFGLATLRMPLLPAELPPDRREMVLLAGRGSYYQAARLSGPAKPPFEELVARFPDSPNVHYAFGVFLLQDDSDRALEMFKRELKLSTSHVPSMLQIAFEYIKRADWEAAKPWAEQAVGNAPGDFVGRRALGQVLLELGDTDEAIKHLEHGVRLAADSASLRFVLARAYQKAGRAADAQRERVEFQRLQRQARAARFGEQAVGGSPDDPNPAAPQTPQNPQ